MAKFKVGDVVKCEDGPNMCVVESSATRVKTNWFVDDELQVKEFCPSSLTLVEAYTG